MSPPYEMELNARIRQTEAFPAGEMRQAAEIKKATDKLRRMTRSDKNKDYLDQIYYALGNIYLAAGDTVQAIKEYDLGVEKSTRGGVEKGILQLTLGNLCWEMGRYVEAQTAYSDAIGCWRRRMRNMKRSQSVLKYWTNWCPTPRLWSCRIACNIWHHWIAPHEWW